MVDSEKNAVNCDWGIHINKYYAIPYRSKGNPLKDSNFSSSILTVFLTLYYFIVIKNYEIDKIIGKHIITHLQEFFNKSKKNKTIKNRTKNNLKNNLKHNKTNKTNKI